MWGKHLVLDCLEHFSRSAIQHFRVVWRIAPLVNAVAILDRYVGKLGVV